MLLVDLQFVANDTFFVMFFNVKRKIWRGTSQNFFVAPKETCGMPPAFQCLNTESGIVHRCHDNR